MILKELIQVFDELWPALKAEEWDNPGLAFGHAELEISGVLLAVDVTPAVIREAVEVGAEIILSHHPVMFREISTLAGDGPTQSLLQDAISEKIALFSAHTNADHVSGGVSDSFAQAIGLIELQPLDPASGHGRVGRLTSAMTLIEFGKHLASVLPATAGGILIQGSAEGMVERVALLAGAGDSFLELALGSGADVYVTSDLRHHRALDFSTHAKDHPVSLVNVSHWAAESMWLLVAKRQLAELCPTLKFTISKIKTDPWDFAI